MTAHRARKEPGRLGARRLISLASVVLLAMTMVVPGAVAQDDDAPESPFGPVDPQNWVDMADLTWDDYTPIRPAAWDQDTTSTGSDSQYRTAIVLMEFPDQPLLIKQNAGAHPFGNPQPGWEPVPAAEASAWYDDYYAVPNEYNGGQTLHGYWMETSHGKIGVTVDVFGPYVMPGKLHEYGIESSMNGPVNTYCPQGDTCNRNLRTDGNAPFQAEVIANGGTCSNALCGYDNLFYVTAGHDESSTWQEFGEMLFASRTDVPASLGPPGATEGPVLNNNGEVMTNWANTRYIEWSSWKASANHWPNAGGGSSTQAESSGQSVFAHEFSHLRGLPDNYNNPFADNIRNYSGYWEMMSRGTFNGPGGTHNRWQVPNQGGSGLGPHHTAKFKRSLDVYEPGDLLEIQRDALDTEGIAVATVQQRSAQPGNGGYLGIRVRFGATTANGQNLRTCAALGHTGANSFWCHGNDNYHNYDVEVVDRVGNDSFTPGHGVLIALTRNTNTAPSVWLIDPNPEDINMVDFYRPDGTPVMVVRGDPRQLNNATWHAGTDSGSEYEFVDDLNNLHFYILDTHRDENGVLTYDIGVRRLTGAGDFDRGVSLGGNTRVGVDPFNSMYEVDLTNTGEAGEGVFDSDIYRISSSISGEGWSSWQPHEVVAAAAGETVPVGVTATREAGASETAVLTVTATSESDPTKTQTVEIVVESPSAALDSLAAVVEDVDPTDAQWKLRRFIDRIDREITAENWDRACLATDVYIAEINRLAGLRPERGPLPAEDADRLRAAAEAVRAALGCD